LGEIVKAPEGRLAAGTALALAAAVYAFGLFLLRREGGPGGRVLRDALALGGAFFLLVIHTPVAEYLAQPLLVRPDVDRADAAVVLGGGLFPNNALTPASLERTLYAVRLHRRGLAPRLIFSGGITGEASRPEGDVMAETAQALGVPGDAIVVERASRTTYENAVEAARLLRERGLRRVLLVTGPAHMYRSQLAFRRQGVQVLPAPTRTREGLRYSAGGRLALFYSALHEYGGLLYYKVRGRI
ncbi:MAG TPA: YdcF family protein, partial [Candidatus Methylomirabilis sp.]